MRAFAGRGPLLQEGPNNAHVGAVLEPRMVHACRRTPAETALQRSISSLTVSRCLSHDIAMASTPTATNPGQRALRGGRRSIQGQCYHIIACTADRRRVFSDLQSGRQVVRSLRRLENVGASRSLAFVVMPDHVHWLMELRAKKSLPACVGTMKSFAARAINARKSQCGPIWQKGYMDRAIRREEDLVRVARYIVANPLRAGIVADIGDYPLWDSVWMNDTAPF